MELLDTIFPHRCASCDRRTEEPAARDLCVACAASVFRIDSDSCPRCALPGFDDSVCVKCRLDPPPFTKVEAVLEFGGAVAEATRRAKYGPDLVAWRAVVAWAEEELRDRLVAVVARGFHVTWVPMASRSARRRGFDPPAIALRWLDVKPIPLLVRRPDGRRQAGTSAASRLDNARAVFDVTSEPPARVCVFDDVVTTGATLRATSELLLRAGADEVVGLAIARTPAFEGV